jgi:hypothetical protein
MERGIADLLIDERSARAAAGALGLHVSGLLGVLIEEAATPCAGAAPSPRQSHHWREILDRSAPPRARPSPGRRNSLTDNRRRLPRALMTMNWVRFKPALKPLPFFSSFELRAWSYRA